MRHCSQNICISINPLLEAIFGGNGMQRCHLTCVPWKGSLNHTLVFGKAQHSRTRFYLAGEPLWHSATTHPLFGIATICSFAEGVPWNRVVSLFHSPSVNDFWAYVVGDGNKRVSWTLDKKQLAHAAAPSVVQTSYGFTDMSLEIFPFIIKEKERLLRPVTSLGFVNLPPSSQRDYTVIIIPQTLF